MAMFILLVKNYLSKAFVVLALRLWELELRKHYFTLSFGLIQNLGDQNGGRVKFRDYTVIYEFHEINPWPSTTSEKLITSLQWLIYD